ncbi:MAG: CoB--CoM heterodisulfide reductase iron-sulfur subunit B family protein [Proteobacteria bacterium]|nr:CoB--CoM heterodisulfide reductase iron-sulfur subunit B family protein [Pseudomonadota bacterium]
MKSYALFLGCSIPARVFHYEASARLVLRELGVELVDVDKFSCCGPVPLRSISFEMFLTVSARNLAIAEEKGLDIMCLCSGCYSALTDANHHLKEDSGLRASVNERLAPFEVAYNGGIHVKHFLKALHQDVGLDTIRERVVRPFYGLRIATHYGCHTTRPSKVVQLDNHFPPVLFDELVEATGAKSVQWATKSACCGGPLLGVNAELALDLCEKKLTGAKAWGADCLCTACPFCQVQFDTIQAKIAADRGRKYDVPSILYPQLLGLAMDLDRDLLGLDHNRLSLAEIEAYAGADWQPKSGSDSKSLPSSQT